ncbi:MAG: hypothetical protein M1503_04720 [Thaumarchaeota archaeon]|nr:hypothetical protein [Nitrososphaerota archaeon]MCL5317554.1 hypothetical protein [Nitrososphaerota archaeon]
MAQEGGVFTALGIMLILLGIILVMLPLLARSLNMQNILGRVPWIILYVYRQDGFVFMTSPILIIISLAFLIYAFLK